MGFLANIPHITEAKAIKPKTIKKLNKELGFDLVERLMQVSNFFCEIQNSFLDFLHLTSFSIIIIDFFYKFKFSFLLKPEKSWKCLKRFKFFRWNSKSKLNYISTHFDAVSRSLFSRFETILIDFMMPAKKVIKWRKSRSEYCDFTKKPGR